MAVFIWIVPYIAEELIVSIPTHVRCGRWDTNTMIQPFAAVLGKMTHDELADDPIVLGLLDDIWTTTMQSRPPDHLYYASYAIYHGYRKVLKDHGSIGGVMKFRNVVYYEKHWDFYHEFQRTCEPHWEHYAETFIEKLYSYAIRNNMSRVYDTEENPNHMLVTAAIHEYDGNDRLKSIVTKGIRDWVSPQQFITLIPLRDFNDVIVENLGNWNDEELRQIYTEAIASGRNDPADRIAKYL